MTCRELVGQVTDYLAHQLGREERARFELHLASCRSCGAHVAQMRQTLRVLEALRGEHEPFVLEELLELFRAWKRASQLG